MKLSDFRGLFRKQDIQLIEMHEFDDNIVEFTYSAEKVKQWRPGEHGLFTLPGKKVKGKSFRGFSLASIYEEGLIKIATRINPNPSSFKKHMLEMKPGETISLRGPFGWFTLQDENSPLVIVAAGIGITPIRALFKELEKGNKRFVTLIYSSLNEHFYRKELEALSQHDERIKIHFIHSKEESAHQLNKAIMVYGNSAFYYVSGMPTMLKSTRKKLRDRSILRSHIITDPFYGYKKK